MNRNLLIDQVVRQTMVLIAHLASHGGTQTPLSDVADRVLRSLEALVQVALFHHGETDAASLATSLGAAVDAVADALAALALDGRAEALPGNPPRYRVTTYLVPASDPAGFEAAVLDHLQAFVGALCHRLRRHGIQTPIDAAIGGSTYTFDIAPDNPAWDRVVGMLTRQRAELSALRDEADAFEAARTKPARTLRFHFYCGENVLGEALPVSPSEQLPTTPSGEPS